MDIGSAADGGLHGGRGGSRFGAWGPKTLFLCVVLSLELQGV